jgi:hypothetical protein
MNRIHEGFEQYDRRLHRNEINEEGTEHPVSEYETRLRLQGALVGHKYPGTENAMEAWMGLELPVVHGMSETQKALQKMDDPPFSDRYRIWADNNGDRMVNLADANQLKTILAELDKLKFTSH